MRICFRMNKIITLITYIILTFLLFPALSILPKEVIWARYVIMILWFTGGFFTFIDYLRKKNVNNDNKTPNHKKRKTK